MNILLLSLAALLALACGAAAVFVYSGYYDVAADTPHWTLTSRLLETMRRRSIEQRSRQVVVPDLQDEKLILKGTGQYAAMCAGCHLAPGAQSSELSRGLYPRPPELAKRRVDPRYAYTAIKHGIKMTGMPAWGGAHGDQQIWALVAFVNKLPELSPQRYQEYIHSPEANAAAAMASHGAMMPRAGAEPAGEHHPQSTKGKP